MLPTFAKHILIAEDEGRLQASLKFYFHGKGYRVSCAKSGEEALEIINASRSAGHGIDLLITDIQMPGMDGEHLIRSIREFDSVMPVLVMTGFGNKELVVRLMKLGCAGYLDKPFSLAQMETQVEALLMNVRTRD